MGWLEAIVGTGSNKGSEDKVTLKIVEYDIITSADYTEVIDEVNQKIEEGWQPFGPCQTALAAYGEELQWDHTQTMVKYDPI
jgi:hypothetical protein